MRGLSLRLVCLDSSATDSHQTSDFCECFQLYIYKGDIALAYKISPMYRESQYVQRALNRGENYHQLRRAVSYANFGKLRFKTEHEQQLWGECARLLTNCIIYYNTVLFSQLAAHKARTGDAQGAAP